MTLSEEIGVLADRLALPPLEARVSTSPRLSAAGEIARAMEDHGLCVRLFWDELRHVVVLVTRRGLWFELHDEPMAEEARARDIVRAVAKAAVRAEFADVVGQVVMNIEEGPAFVRAWAEPVR